MKSLVFRSLCMLALGGALGIVANLGAAPDKRVSWIWAKKEAAPAATSAVSGDVSTQGMKVLSASGFAYLLDARIRDEYCAGHIPGAVSFPIRKFFENPDAFSERIEEIRASGMPVIIYCGGGDCEDSHSLAKQLRLRNFTSVLVYTGGWEAWEKEGLEAELCK